MADQNYLDWPFFEQRHRALEAALDKWALDHVTGGHGKAVDEACRKLVRQLGDGGWLKYAIGGVAYGAVADSIDTRAVCLIRETLARHSGLADFAFAMQGLGSGAISLFGSHEQKQRYLPRVANGSAIAAFAISEPDAGSDVAALQCEARNDGERYVINGEKTWISNGGIADFYLTFARTGNEPGAKGISAFIVDATTPGLEVTERIEVMAPHPLARLTFKNCRIPGAQRLGDPGQGFTLAMSTLDIFRSSVAAAAGRFARRPINESLSRSTSRKMFVRALGDFPLTQANLPNIAPDNASAALLTYRAAWLKDMGRPVTVEAAMAKM